MSTDWKKGHHKVFSPFSPSSFYAINRVPRTHASGFFFFACLPFLSEANIFYKLIFSDHLPTQICTGDVFFFFLIPMYHNSFWWKLILSTTTKGLFTSFENETIRVGTIKVYEMSLFFILRNISLLY